MEFGKYIVLQGICTQAILFDCTQNHSDFLEMFSRDYIISAGMFCVGAKASKDDPDDIDVSVFGESVTLNLKPDKEKDEWLIKRILRKPMI